MNEHDFKSFAKHTVAVADGAVAARAQVRSTLSRMGFDRVIEVESGKRLLTLLSQQKIGVVVCDWKLPDMEGMALLRHMRDTERYIVTPFIMTAVELRKEEIMELLQEGVSDLLLKPFTTRDLTEKLHSALVYERRVLKRLR